MPRGKGLFTVKGDVGFMGRDMPRSCLKLLRYEEQKGDAHSDGVSGSGSRAGGGGLRARLRQQAEEEEPEKVVKVSKRHISYRKAQEVARLQEVKVGQAGYSVYDSLCVSVFVSVCLCVCLCV